VGNALRAFPTLRIFWRGEAAQAAALRLKAVSPL